MPTVKCVVEGCRNTSYQGGEKRKFHWFPKDEARRQEWIRAVKKEGVLAKCAVVCSDHFEDSDYKVKGEKIWLLEKTAVPTLKLSTSEDAITPPPKRRRNEAENFVDQAKAIITGINNQPSSSSASENKSPRKRTASEQASTLMGVTALLSVAVAETTEEEDPLQAHSHCLRTESVIKEKCERLEGTQSHLEKKCEKLEEQLKRSVKAYDRLRKKYHKLSDKIGKCESCEKFKSRLEIKIYH